MVRIKAPCDWQAKRKAEKTSLGEVLPHEVCESGTFEIREYLSTFALHEHEMLRNCRAATTLTFD
jgi:hypothetical protein